MYFLYTLVPALNQKLSTTNDVQASLIIMCYFVLQGQSVEEYGLIQTVSLSCFL